MITLTRVDFDKMEKYYRTHFFNALSGFRSASLVGTISGSGATNLAIFSNIVHLGANPSLIGIIVRPAVVPRHSLLNIEATKCFTINHIHSQITAKAHQTSSRYPSNISEFEAVGLTPFFSDRLAAPYVEESLIRIGLEWRETIPITTNNTLLIAGEVVEVMLPENILKTDGFIDLESAGSVVVAGLDAYHNAQRFARYTYAKPNSKPSLIDD